ncbi:MAG: BON domain-containing protein [Vicinamibacterales bacterium]
MIRGSFRKWVGAAALAFATVACSQTDPGLTTAVKAKLAADDTVKAYRIDVDTKDGVVTLSGEVDTAGAKARAVELARGTDGVRNVMDNTTIKAGVTPPGGLDDAAQAKVAEQAREAEPKADRAGEAVGDAAITSKVKTKFLADTSIAGLRIDVDTRDNVVTLSGTVASAAQKARAVSVAKRTDGVRSVVDKLKVQ